MANIEKIRILRQKIPAAEIEKYLGAPFDNMIKFVVDIKMEIMAIGGEMHADAEKILLEDGSKQENLWGANLYPRQVKESRIEFTSLINIRPSMNNLSLEVKDRGMREIITKIVNNLIRF